MLLFLLCLHFSICCRCPAWAKQWSLPNSRRESGRGQPKDYGHRHRHGPVYLKQRLHEANRCEEAKSGEPPSTPRLAFSFLLDLPFAIPSQLAKQHFTCTGLSVRLSVRQSFRHSVSILVVNVWKEKRLQACGSASVPLKLMWLWYCWFCESHSCWVLLPPPFSLSPSLSSLYPYLCLSHFDSVGPSWTLEGSHPSTESVDLVRRPGCFDLSQWNE